MHSGQRSAGPKPAEPQTARAHGGLLSPGERALWFLQRLAPGSAAFNLAGVVRVARLDAAALRRAVLRLVERHPALRTTFPIQDGEPVRQVQGWLEPELAEEDVGGLPCSTVRERLEAEALRPFDPERGPLLRVRTFQHGGQGAALFVFHHLIADFWSLTIILRELGDLYGEETGGAPAELLPPPARYEQWVERQGLELSGPRGEALREFWLERLAGPVPVLGLPADRPRPAEPSGAGVGGSGRLGQEATARLQAHARERGATLFAAALASFQLLLHRITGDEEIWVGVPAAGRGPARWARTVGYFVNPVVLRGRPEGAASFTALLDRARTESEEALAHREWPFPWLTEELHPVRDGGRTPLFQAMLVLYRTRYKEEEPLALLALGEGGGMARLGGLEIETLPLDRRGAQLDISLTAAVVAGELRLRLELDADRFDAATARVLLNRLEALLEAAAERPETPGDDLPLLREPERQALFFEWNDPRAAAPAEGSLDALVADQAERTPQATALVCGERRLTYRELMERVERLARCLRALGAGPEMRVGICAGRSPDLVIGILGILRTGAAYVPLDPAHPQERLAWTLEDSGAALLLAESSCLSLLPVATFTERGGRLVLLDPAAEEDEVAGEDGEAGAGPGPQRLAYVLYTSGSTGRPKGVAVSHANLLNFCAGMDAVLRPGGTWLAVTSVSFDISVLELLWTLARGFTVVVEPAPGDDDPDTLANRLRRNEVTHLQCTPSMARMLAADSDALDALGSLHTLLLGGEALPPSLVARLPRPPGGILNMYGPTETTIWSSVHAVPGPPLPPQATAGGAVPIGRPIVNTSIHIVDARAPALLRPMPPGSRGELVIGGAGVARGYLGRPDLTAERFVPDPFTAAPGARLYRTGDLARFLADGTLEFHGRIDQQVKVRGFRIELGEVEAALAEHPAVREAVVELREDASGDRRLVAWIAGAGVDPDPAALRDHLAVRLPGPMVPSAFVPLETLPLTPNGKVDRRALAARPLPEDPPPAGYVPPRNSVEDSLAAVFAEVLGREQVGARDDFFALGGHSLLATRVLARVSELFRVDLPLRDLFEAPTPTALAERLRVTARGRTAPPILPGAPGDPVVLSFAQERFWFLHRLEPDTPAYNVAGAVRIRGPLRIAALERALGEIARRHEVLRTCFPEVDGAPVARVEPPSPEPFPLARIDLAGLALEPRQAAAERLAAETAAAPFDLAGGPLLRIVLVRLGAEEHDLLVSVHHIAADGASIDLFFRELATLYRESGALPELTVQYADYARWQRSWLTGDVLEARLSWWEEELEGAPTALDLPTDRPRSAASTSRGGLRSLSLAPGLAESLDALRGRLMGTRFMSFAAVYQTLLGRLSGQGDVLIGTPVSERSRRELEPLVGCLINTLVLRGRMGDDPPFEEQLRRIRTTSLAIWAHQELPFERLVERLPGARDASRTPLFQALLTAQSERGTALELGDAAVALRELDSGAAKLDLSLTLEAADPGLRAILRYRRDLFDAATAERLLEHFETLLAGGLADPSRPLSELPLLGPAQRHQVLAEWGEGDPPRTAELPVHELIRRQAAATPEAPAVLFDGRLALSWRELRRRTLHLARRLREQGAAPGAVVGISLDRSVDLVVAVLATLETGAAYLPLDPAYPEEYLAYVVEDSAVSIILSNDFPWPLPEPGEEPEPLGAGGPPLPLEAWAYVLYTSGSTGKPKGTPVTHRALRNYLEWVLDEPLAGTDGILFLTSLNFDASLKQLFAPLLLGRPVRLLSDDSARRPERLLGLLRGSDRMALNCVPSLWRAVLDLLESGPEPARERVPALARLLLGGEGFDRDLVERTLRLLPGLEVWNLYGPTEATANASAARLAADDRYPLGIGRPIRGVCLHVLDPVFQLVPPGTAGELVIGGVGVSPGYWKRPDLTAGRFVPDPFAESSGARLFRTGDLARWRADGSLELLGRIDRQLKIRGLRIEPGEVETALAAHPAVAECVVGADPAGSRLVAWVVPRAGSALVAAELRRSLEALLPPALVPSVFVILGAMPRLPNGKVHHGALPAPEAPVPQTAAAGPRSQAEEVLAWLWCEVLEVPSIGIHDDFFERGGHSLLAARLLARVRGVFAVDLPLRTLFAAPTVARLAEAVAAARRERRDEEVPVEPVPRTGPLPLSFDQERLWFIDQWLPESPAYNIPAAVRLRGPLDVAALGAALAEIVRRHETLRTTFTATGGRPVQILQPEMKVPLPVADLAGLDCAEPAWRALAAAEARRGFDLRRGPLLRTTLLRLGNDDHVLVVNLHHIVSDGWSMGVLIEELRTLYVAFHEGLPSPLPALTLQYADYAVWQRGLAERETLARDLDWWHGFLAGAPAALELPADRPRPLWSIHRGGVEPVVLPPALAARLHELARRGEVTLFMILLAGFELLLARLAGVEDLVVGTAVAQRTPEVEGLIGLFVNLLALRGDLSGDPPFTELLARTRRATLEAHDHQHVPFERLVASLEPVRDPGRHPLFQVALTLQNAPMPEAIFPGLALEIEQLDTGTARFDLTLLLHEENGGLAGALEHSADLFDRSTVRRLLASWASLLAGIVDDPGRPVSLLPLMSEAEHRQILEVWSHGADQRPREACLHELFARQAARTPDAVALVEESEGGETEITYGELDRRSALLAWRLRAAGAGPDVPVAVLLERSADMVVALAGILRAGAGYVPLDLGYPQERLAWMLEDSGAGLVVARGGDSGGPGGLAGLGGGARVVRIDDLPADRRVEPPVVAVSPDHLAYIVYTSGSTGKPKGVAATHRGVTRVVIDPGYVELGPEETILQLAPVPFDASTFEIWGALLNGGRLAIYPAGPLALHELSAALRRHRVTTLFLTTGLFHQMIDEEPEGLAGLRQLITGGDVISVSRVRRALEALPGCRLVHAYGPTETTTYATCQTVTPADAARPALTLGRPIPRTSVWLFDERLEPVPAGVPGELFLGGDGLARGYWRRPDLTAPRFVPHPFPAAPGERLYRTGDLARWLPDGTIDFLGRIDRQVKIRGFRVEPAEIEATLERHPAVAAAVVAPRDDGRGNKRLVAWIVGEDVSESALLAWCREHLPAFMVPAAFVRLEALPLDPNGKVDRRALPAPGHRGGHFVPPQTPEEEWIAAVWAEVLGAGQVGVEDDFFSLGGHSLLAARLISRLRAVFGVDLPVRALFEHPTVGALAAEVGRLVRAGVGAPPPPRPRAGRGPVAPLSFAQRRLWVLHQLEPGLAAYHIPAVLRLRGRLERGVLARALGEIVRRHEALRTSFLVVEGEPFQEVAPAADVELPGVDLSALPEDRRQAEAGRIGEAAARHPFDLEHGPLLRLLLLRLGAEEHLLVLVVHHLVFDGWSTAVFLRELSALYTAFRRGLRSPLPEPALQLGDWALWQREHLQGEALAAQLSWWRDRLASAPRVLDLPTDFPRPPGEAQAGASVPVRLPEALIAALRGLGQTEGATLFMVLLAAFQALLSRWSGEETVCTGTHVAGRSRLESEDLIGFFINTVVIRTDLDGDPSGRELIARVREMVLGAFAHQDLPFEKLVEALQPPRQPGVPPLYQVAFTLQNTPREEIRLPGLEADLMPAETGTTQLDLSLSLIESAGGVTGEIRYRTALFSEPTVRRLVRHYENLLAALTKEPGRSSLELPLLSAEERAQVVERWSGLAVSRAFGRATFPALFEAQADRTPDAPAVVLAGRTLTYRELDQKANRVAHWLRSTWLRSHGRGPETRVALRLERSPEMLAALLGVWKAGAAYVPIDAATPPERLAFLREDAAAALELTGGDVERLELAGEDDGRLGLAVEPEQLAYVIYTSGSTGQPKGVMVSHESLMAFSPGLGEMIHGGGEGLRFAINASLAFDASLQFFLPLLTGAGVWIVPEEARHDADHMADFLRAADLDGIDCTPSQLELILDAMDASGRPPRLVLVGGEPIPPALWRRMAGRSGTRFWNVYGPTECTINVTARQVEGERPDLGHPWPGARVWLLEPAGLPAPAGARAEIWLGGPQVARGYLGHPDLTADRFRPDPFSGEAGARLYRTGDLARWLPDGRLDLLGRADQQVKLRGHRIELGEIEAQLLTHPMVREAAAGLRADSGGSPRLVAWIVLAEGLAGETGPRELRRWLGEHLPGSMVPSAFVVLDRLPKTTSGKLDRRALPAPSRAGSAIEPAAPSGDRIERKLRELFREVLEVDRVDPSDSLFELGGHSMTAFRLATRIREAFGVRLAVSRLFTDPTPAALAELIRGMERDSSGLAPVRHVPRDRPLPLSLAQQRLWVLHQITPGLTTYHIPAGLRLRGRLDVPALHGALTEILRRHEALRTRFPLWDGEPVQWIDPPVTAPFPVLDLGSLPMEGREAEARRIARAEALRPFDLESGPLLRLGLLHLDAEEHILLLVVHHLVSDGWSAALFLRELSALYEAGLRGEPSPLPEPRVQYADWAVWQREQLQGEALETHLHWWTERLAGAPRVLDLPLDRPRPPVEDPAGASVPLSLPKTLVEPLRQLALAEGGTLYMTLLAGFQALLARISGQETVSVGTHVARRNRLEVEGLIGFFVNTVVIRADISGEGGERTGRELVHQVRDSVFGAFAHQDLPFERLVEALGLERDPRWSPLFQVSFALQNAPHEEPRLPGLDVELLETGTDAGHFDLAATLTETADGGAAGAFSYRTALFFASTIRRLAGQYEAFLEALAAQPDAPLSALSLLTAPERHQILVEWAGPERAYPEQGLPELFAEQAARTPDAVAVVCGTDSMTYGDLDRSSSQLAGWLRGQGLGPESAVAISVERSLEMVVGLLGILKSGAAYLPIDPLNPRERQAFLLEDAGVPILLTQEKWADGFQAPGRRVVCLDEPSPPGPLSHPCSLPPGRDNIQALLYTSGSTGCPKATVLEAQGLLNLCLWFRDVCPIGPSTRSLLGFSFSFDAAFKNILVPLLAGGRTVLPPPGPFDAGEMLEAIRRERITFLNTTPSQMIPILQRAAAEEWAGLESLETLILGGEAAPWPELRPWLASGRCQAEILHMYGPSEASDTVSCHRATHAEIAGIADSGRLPVGRAADNTRLVVVAAGFEPLPIGVPGELCLAGDGVARGYLGRPALTAEKFIPDPFHPGARMYRTGDLARWLADGSLEILGRIDQQVKIRGIRVEPAEVEAALMTHPAIGGAVVEGRDSAKGEKRLIAWIVLLEGTGSPDPAELREHLRTRLPEVMIPTAFVILPAFPVSPRGKIDRSALPDPGAKTEDRPLLPPRDEIELRLAGLFQEVLGGDVGIHDSFFDRGGHSLAAVRLVARIRETFDVPFRVADLFLAPTVEELARLVRKDRKPVVSRLVPLRPSGDRTPLFLLPPGGGSVFGYVELVRRLDPSRPVFGLQARGLEEGQEPLRDLGEMAEQYLAEIRRAQPSGPLHLAGWSFGGLLAFEVAQRLRARGDEIAVLALIDPTDPPDILGITGGELALGGLIRELGIPPEGFELSPEEEALSPEDRLTLLFEKAREAGRLRPWDDLPELRRRFEVIRANAEAACAFRPGPYDGPLDLFEPTDRDASIAGNWRPLARNIHVLPGTHYSLLLPPQVDALAAALRELLDSQV